MCFYKRLLPPPVNNSTLAPVFRAAESCLSTREQLAVSNTAYHPIRPVAKSGAFLSEVPRFADAEQGKSGHDDSFEHVGFRRDTLAGGKRFSLQKHDAKQMKRVCVPLLLSLSPLLSCRSTLCASRMRRYLPRGFRCDRSRCMFSFPVLNQNGRGVVHMSCDASGIGTFCLRSNGHYDREVFLSEETGTEWAQ